jgi:chemotaxis protein methyltransferase CheR
MTANSGSRPEVTVEDLDPVRVRELLELVYEQYDYDFRDYSTAHLFRRIANRMSVSGISSFDVFAHKVLTNPDYALVCFRDLSIKVTEMYRDPDFYAALREQVIPLLKTYSFIKIWHAGCATGEEVYSMAIMLQEEGLYERSLIYATDFSEEALSHAREGIYLSDKAKLFSRNYQLSGGSNSLSDYYTAQHGRIILNKSLKKNIVWANHNLVTDRVFAEVNLIFCRNVLIYFNRNLQDKVHMLFVDSLANGGILCLGQKESLLFSAVSHKYSVLDKEQKIYRKKYGWR